MALGEGVQQTQVPAQLKTPKQAVDKREYHALEAMVPKDNIFSEAMPNRPAPPTSQVQKLWKSESAQEQRAQMHGEPVGLSVMHRRDANPTWYCWLQSTYGCGVTHFVQCSSIR